MLFLFVCFLFFFLINIPQQFFHVSILILMYCKYTDFILSNYSWYFIWWASLMAQMVKNLPAVWENWVQSPGPEDPLEKGIATHSSILASRIPWTEEPGGYRPWGCKESDTTGWLTNIFHLMDGYQLSTIVKQATPKLSGLQKSSAQLFLV